MTASRPIGGVFPLPEPDDCGGDFPPLRDPKAIFLVNGRSAIDYVLRVTRARRIWLPSYVCASVVAAAAACEIRWYDVGAALTPQSDAWLREVSQGDVVLFIDYFGWRQSAGWFERVHARGAHVLEDGSQSLLTGHLGEGADFHFTVPRKFVGVPDGAVLLPAAATGYPPPHLDPPPGDWWQTALAANEGRRDFDHGVDGADWFAAFRNAEATQPLGPVAMSDFSRSLLSDSFDFAAIAARRRENYALLAAELGAMALFPTLPQDVVPIGFPIRLADRDRQQERLFKLGIYPPIHWDIAGIVPDEFHASHRLSREIMTLPCDQRYGASDMGRINRAFVT